MRQQTRFFEGVKQAPADNYSNRGMALEHALNDMHGVYAAMGRALITHQYPAFQRVNAQGEGRVVGKSTVDYEGVVNGGLHIAFDAKTTVETSIQLSRLQVHQLQYLIDVERMGGIAFVLVQFEHRRCYRVPALAWKSAVDACNGCLYDVYHGWHPSGKASLKESELPKSWAVYGVDWMQHGVPNP